MDEFLGPLASPPTKEVHEYWAQVALEFGDFKQFDQAAAQLEAKMGAIFL